MLSKLFKSTQFITAASFKLYKFIVQPIRELIRSSRSFDPDKVKITTNNVVFDGVTDHRLRALRL
jgi:hypothetical protein